MAPSKSTPQGRGLALEKRVAKLLRQSRKSNVKSNVLMRDKHGNLSEIDVCYGRWPFKHYIECKAYRKDRPVPLEDVAKFKQVLELNNINTNRGIVVTTSTFSPRCKHIGVRLINGEELSTWERSVRRNIWFRRSILSAFAGSFLVASYCYPNETKDIIDTVKDQSASYYDSSKEYFKEYFNHAYNKIFGNN
jgi:hypothetical protein